MPPKKDNKRPAEEKEWEKKKKSNYVLFTVVDQMGGFMMYSIPIERLGSPLLEQLIEAAAQGKRMDVIPDEEAPLALKHLAIRVGHYVYDKKGGDDESLAVVKEDLKDCFCYRNADEPGAVFHLNPVFSLTSTDWC